jgi:hypothetical protein
MKQMITGITLVCVLMFVTSGCGEGGATPSAPQQEAPAAPQPTAAPQGWTGTVAETMNTAGYTYVKIDTGTEQIWAAAPETQVKVGDTVSVPPGAPMKNYQSKTLNRTFDVVYFVPSINKPGAAPPAAKAPAGAMGMPGMKKKAPSAKVDLSGIAKAEGGKTIAEIFAEKEALGSKTVTVRGKVVKFNPNIMGTNWLHVQDGTGAAGTNDLTVTTDAEVQIGDTVLVTGALMLNKDLGSGYKFDVIIEKAQVAVEK